MLNNSSPAKSEYYILDGVNSRRSLWSRVTFKDRTLPEFQFCLRVLIALHVISAGLEIYVIFTVFSAKRIFQITLQVLCILGVIHSSLSAVLVRNLIYKLSKNVCLVVLVNTLLVVVLFCAQIIVGNTYYSPTAKEFFIIFIVNIAQIAFQVTALVLIYRFWQYLMYNHDFSNGAEDNDSDSDSHTSLRDSLVKYDLETDLPTPRSNRSIDFNEALIAARE